MSCDQLRREITILRDDLSFANQRAEDAKAELEIMRGFYLAAIALAEAAEARADEMEVDRDNWKVRADAAEYEVMARPGIDKQFQALNEGLIAARAELAALQAAGEWRPRVPGPIFNADSAPHGVKSILYLSVDATRDLDSGLWDWDDNGDWYVHGYQPLPTPPADDSERYNPREPAQ